MEYYLRVENGCVLRRALLSNKVTPLVTLLCGAALLSLSACALGQTLPSKPAMLKQLTGASKAQMATRASAAVRSQPREASQLALDLVFYRWAANASGAVPDVRGTDIIIPELTRALADPTVEWALEMFPANSSGRSPVKLPPWDDERVSRLSDLRRLFGAAMDYRNSYPVEAVKALKDALTLCQTLRLDISEALVRKELGDHYMNNMSRYRDAEVCYTRAALIFSPYECLRSSAIVYDSYGQLNSRLGRSSAAADNYKLAAQQWLLLADTETDGQKYRMLAGQQYIKAGNAQLTSSATKGLELMEHGLDHLWKHAFATRSFAEYTANAIDVAQRHRERGGVSKALDLLEKAKKAAREENDPLLTANVYGELSKCYEAAGQTANATEAARKRGAFLGDAKSDGEAAAAELRRAASTLGDKRAALHRRIQRGARACESLRDFAGAESLWRTLAEDAAKTGSVEQRANYLRSLAGVLDIRAKPDESLEARLEAAVAVKNTNKVLARDIGLEMVQALVAAGDLTNALEVFRDLVPIFEASGDVRGAAGMLEGRGDLLIRSGKHTDAAADYADARRIYLEQVGDPWAAGSISLKLASAQIEARQPNDARATLESALRDIELTHETPDPSVDLHRGSVLRNLHRQLAAEYVKAGREDDAASLLKKARRHPWISDLIDDMRSDSDPTVAAFAASWLDILGTTGPAGDPGTGPSPARLWADGWAQFLTTCAALRNQHQLAYRALPIDPAELLKNSRLMPKDTVVITYMPAAASVYAFVCGYDRAVIREIGVSASEIDALVSRLRAVIRNYEMDIPAPPMNDWQEPAFLEIRGPLADLYERLVAPVAGDLQRRVIFALIDDMKGLPMHALVSSLDNQIPRFLIQDHEVSYLAEVMLTDLVGRDSRGIDSSSDRLAIFADPEGNLPGARGEATAIRNVYSNSQWYLAERATAANFLREIDRAAILHIAAHHWIDPDPSRFELRLARTEDSDGIVGIEELATLADKRVGLVVLSACDALSSSDPISTGPSRAAEMLSALGVKSVLGGLWKVSDDAASAVMAGFYRGLSRGQSRTEALQRAQVGMIESKKHAHPFYWACFALFGNPR